MKAAMNSVAIAVLKLAAIAGLAAGSTAPLGENPSSHPGRIGTTESVEWLWWGTQPLSFDRDWQIAKLDWMFVWFDNLEGSFTCGFSEVLWTGTALEVREHGTWRRVWPPHGSVVAVWNPIRQRWLLWLGNAWIELDSTPFHSAGIGADRTA
ncbi:MAG: hypothetical protein AMXMBFR58_28280 [Phycisphaerae bacterium]